MNSYIVPEYFSQNELPSSARMNTIVSAIKNLNENLQSHNHTGTLNGPKLHATNALIEHSFTANIFNSSITNDDKTGLILNISGGDNYANLGVKTANNDIQVLDAGIRLNPTLTNDYTFTGNITADIHGTAEINGNPVGTVIPMIGKNLVTNGVGNDVYKLKTGNYLFCNGATIKRADGYGTLITILTGDATASEAQLPNITDGRFLKGSTLNQSGTPEIAGIPNHYHVFGSNAFHNNAGGFVSTNFRAISGTVDDTLPSRGYVGWNGSGHDSAEFHSTATFSGCMVTTLVNQSSTSISNGVYGKKSTVIPLNMSVNYFIRY